MIRVLYLSVPIEETIGYLKQTCSFRAPLFRPARSCRNRSHGRSLVAGVGVAQLRGPSTNVLSDPESLQWLGEKRRIGDRQCARGNGMGSMRIPPSNSHQERPIIIYVWNNACPMLSRPGMDRQRIVEHKQGIEPCSPQRGTLTLKNDSFGSRRLAESSG